MAYCCCCYYYYYYYYYCHYCCHCYYYCCCYYYYYYLLLLLLLPLLLSLLRLVLLLTLSLISMYVTAGSLGFPLSIIHYVDTNMSCHTIRQFIYVFFGIYYLLLFSIVIYFIIILLYDSLLIILQYRTNWFLCILETDCVLSEERTHVSFAIYIDVSIQWVHSQIQLFCMLTNFTLLYTP
jgi:hypothetical protein